MMSIILYFCAKSAVDDYVDDAIVETGRPVMNKYVRTKRVIREIDAACYGVLLP